MNSRLVLINRTTTERVVDEDCNEIEYNIGTNVDNKTFKLAIIKPITDPLLAMLAKYNIENNELYTLVIGETSLNIKCIANNHSIGNLKKFNNEKFQEETTNSSITEIVFEKED